MRNFVQDRIKTKGMKTTIVFLSFLFYAAGLCAQNFEKVTVSYVKTGEGLYDFYVENPNHYPVQFQLIFTQFENMMAGEELPLNRTVPPGKHFLLNIRRIYLDIPGNFKYTYQTRVGGYPVMYDPQTVYRLPVATGKSTRAIDLEATNADDPGRVVKVFSFHEGDTVFCCREGVVCMKTETEYRNGFRTGENALTLVHPDGSFGKYEVFADSLLFVGLGDSLKAGAPLGVAGGTQYAVGPHNRFSVYYVHASIDSILTYKLRQYHTFVDPLFQTAPGTVVQVKADGEYVQER